MAASPSPSTPNFTYAYRDTQRHAQLAVILSFLQLCVRIEMVEKWHEK
jgi:hypothetical protein